MAVAATRKHALLSGGEVSVLIGLLDAAGPHLSKELRAVAQEYRLRLDERTKVAAPPGARAARRSYEVLRSGYLALQTRTELAIEAARSVRAENAALRGVVRKTLALVGTTGPVPNIKAGDELLVSLRSDLTRYAA